MIECETCKKKNTISGQAFREYKCESCGKMKYHHNTNTPKICKECAEHYHQCQRCREIIRLNPELMQCPRCKQGELNYKPNEIEELNCDICGAKYVLQDDSGE